MEWMDDGIVLSARRHGESAAILNVLTREHGRHAGLVRGYGGQRARGLHEPGNELRLVWRGRLSEHLGFYGVELEACHAARLLDEPATLAALAAACAVADGALPEREPHPGAFEAMRALLASFSQPIWPVVFIHWELGLLRELGYGLDLVSCAATGTNDNLIYVSPKTGRAVSAAAGEPYADRLLKLPAFLQGRIEADPPPEDLRAGLKLTGHFLERCVFHPRNQSLPAARTRLIDRLQELAPISGG